MSETFETINDQDIYEEAAALAIEEQLDGDVEIEAIEDEADADEQGEQEVQMTLTLEQIVDQILEATWKAQPTLYTISTALNGVLEAIGATKDGKDYRVRSQMMYQYNSNKLIAKGSNGKGVKIDGAPTRDQARAFIIKFASKFAK